MNQSIKEKFKKLALAQHYTRMYPYIYKYRYRALLSILLAVPVGAMDAVIAMFLQPFMDTVMIDKNVEQASYIPILIIVFSFFQSACNYGSTYFNAWVGGKITRDLQATIFQKVIRFEASFFDSSTSGTILTRCNSDVGTACSGLLTSIRLLFVRLFSSIALIGVLLWNSWQLSLIAIFALAIAVYPLTLLRKKIKDLVARSVVVGAANFTNYNESFAGNRVVTSYNLYDYITKKFKDNLQESFRIGMKMTQRTGILSPLMHFIVSFGIAGVIWLGSYLIINNFLTPGEFVSFIAALLMLYTPMKTMGNAYSGLLTSFLAMDRVFEILERDVPIQDCKNAKELKSISNSIQYKDVSFSYIEDKPVLKNISLDIEVGQNVAFVGNSGGGKTTIVNLLPRFYEIQKGSISIDGTNIKDYSLESLRDSISIVFQDNFLFTGTIRDNIVLDKKDKSDKEIYEVLRNACLDEFVDSLDLGLDTEIGERGILLSGGQKQRIGIARAFIKNAPIVILDEATSALDNKSEAIVQKAINNLMKDRTVLIIAHRLSTIKNADKIVVINSGEISEIGTHDELIANQKSQYYALYNSSAF